MTVLPEPAPRFYTSRDPTNKTYGHAVGAIAKLLGRELMPWQQYCADVSGEVDEQGRFVYPVVVYTVPRQAGKSALAIATCIQRALMRPSQRVWHTAQTGLDARDLFRQTADEVRESPLAPFVKIRESAGSEHIRFDNGSTLRPHPPTQASLHGKQSDLNFIDEAWSFGDVDGQALMQAIVPTQATRPGAQTIIVSTAGTAESTWFREFVERGRNGDKGIAYFEWSIPEGVDPLDLAEVAKHHPAYGHTMDMAAFEAAAVQFGETPGAFARAYGNRWTQASEQVIPLDAWERCQTDTTIPVEARVAFGAAVSIDREHSAIVAAAIVGGNPIVELVEYRDGADWVGPRLQELNQRHANAGLVVDAHGPSTTVVDWLTVNNVELLPLGTRDVTAATASFLDRIKNGDVQIRTNAYLTAAAEYATTRPVGEAFAWSRRKSSGCIAALEAATLAVRGITHLAPPPVAPAIYFGS